MEMKQVAFLLNTSYMDEMERSFLNTSVECKFADMVTIEQNFALTDVFSSSCVFPFDVPCTTRHWELR